MDYMTEIAGAALPILSADPPLGPELERVCEQVEAALKNELGWSRFLDVWRDGSPREKSEMLADLLYRKPQIGLLLVNKLLDRHFPAFLQRLVERIRQSEPSPALALYRHLADDELLPALLLSPERVLTLAELFELPVPLRTAEHALWSAAQNVNESDTTRLRYLISRLARLKEQLKNVASVVDRTPDAALTNRGAYRSAVDREVERTEASMRHLEQLLAGMRIKPAAGGPTNSSFYPMCRKRAHV